MANTSRSRSGNSSSRSSKTGSSRKNTRSASSRSSSRRTSAPVQAPQNPDSAFKRLASSKAAMPLIFIASVILIVGIDLLISWNQYSLFFKILGVEILIAVIVWTVMTLVFSRKKQKEPDSEYIEDEE